MQGRDLRCVGLEDAIVKDGNGQMYPLAGFTCYPDLRIIESMLLCLPENAQIYADLGCYLMDVPVRLH